MKFTYRGIIVIAALASLTACYHFPAADAGQTGTESARFQTQVLSRADAESMQEDWGTFIKYFEGRSAGTEDALSGVAEIKPGYEIHPPHSHTEEEYLMVLEGNGTCSVNGETFEAGPGDMLYADPWDVHGIKNTGTTTLTFVFWKARPDLASAKR